MHRTAIVALSFLVSAEAFGGTATLTDAGAKNVGSSAAYVAICEMENFLTTGTLADFMFELQQNLISEHWNKVKTQYQLSLHERKQFSIAKDKWIPFIITRDNCSNLGKALPMVTAALRKHSQ